MAEALYRKYRPQVFEDVVGQEPIERTLKNAISQDKVSHAYLFCGPRGTGKTTTARLLAKALLCQAGPTPDPDGTCEDCKLIADGAHPDVYELDAASRTGVENVREEIISRVQFAPTRGRSKVYIIDEVHMLSTAAFNALLKTLEEPPGHVVFVLCTTDPQKVPETIHSRCQRFDFRRIAPESMVSRLGAICIAEGVEFEGEALDLIAHRAEGGLRNALTSLEQIIAFENGRVTLAGAERLLGSIDSNDMAEIISYVGKRDIANCFRWTAAYVETGADLAQFVRDMAEHVRNLYVLALVGDDADLDINETTRHELISELSWFGPDRLSRLMGVLGDLSSELKTSSNPRLAFEIALTRMVRPDSDLTLESLAERIEALESGYSAVAHVVPGQPQAQQAQHVSQAAGAQALERAPQAQEPQAGQAWGQGAGFSQAHGGASEARPDAMANQQQQHNRQSMAGGLGQRPMAAQGSADPRGASTQVADVAFAGEAYRATNAAADTARQPSQPPVLEAAPEQSQSYSQPQQQPQDSAYNASRVSADANGAASMLTNPATMQRIWQAALSALKKQKQAYGVLFMNAKARFDEAAGMVKVTFPAEAAFAFSAVQKPDVQEALASALAHAVGGTVAFMYEKAGEAQAGLASSPATGASMAQPRTASPSQGEVREAQGTAAQFAQPSQAGPIQGAGAAPAQDYGAQPGVQPHAQADRAAQRVPSPENAPQNQAVQEQRPFDQVPYEDVPYDPVPYDEMPYEPVPYEDLSPQDTPSAQPGGTSESDVAFAQPAGFDSKASAADASTGASPMQGNITPDGALAEDPSNVEALLQAGFGGGVVFSEVEE